METRIKHPHRDALPTLLALTVLSAGVGLLGGLFTWLDVLPSPVILYVAGAMGLFFGMVLVIIWLLGLNQMRRIAAFLGSDRVLVHWTYTPEEWADLRQRRYDATRGDWKVALGCLTVLFAITGGLTGVLIGLDESLVAAAVTGALGLLFGGVAGGLLGLAVSGGNVLGAWLAARDPRPEQVALGASEVFANDQYFRSHPPGRYVRQVSWDPEDANTLLCDIWNPKIRGESDETWSIVVPSRMHLAVDAVLPHIPTPSDSQQHG